MEDFKKHNIFLWILSLNVCVLGEISCAKGSDANLLELELLQIDFDARSCAFVQWHLSISWRKGLAGGSDRW